MAQSPEKQPHSLVDGPARGLSPALARNIHALMERAEAEAAAASRQERMADAITKFAGSMTFVYLHLVIFGGWITANVGLLPFVPAWDPSLVVLAMVASVEAIFLSTFVMISQNRMAGADSKRADLNLQISLLTEHEITRLATLLAAVAGKLEVHTNVDGELEQIQKDVAPEAVLDQIEAIKAKER